MMQEIKTTGRGVRHGFRKTRFYRIYTAYVTGSGKLDSTASIQLPSHDATTRRPIVMKTMERGVSSSASKTSMNLETSCTRVI
jgi:hypothetical protein